MRPSDRKKPGMLTAAKEKRVVK